MAQMGNVEFDTEVPTQQLFAVVWGALYNLNHMSKKRNSRIELKPHRGGVQSRRTAPFACYRVVYPYCFLVTHCLTLGVSCANLTNNSQHNKLYGIFLIDPQKKDGGACL